jgi:cephalosporin hydroxylase
MVTGAVEDHRAVAMAPGCGPGMASSDPLACPPGSCKEDASDMGTGPTAPTPRVTTRRTGAVGGEHRGRPLSADEHAVVRQFSQLYWRRNREAFFANRFLGVPCFQHPFDAWVTQEIICEVQPDVIVECGSLAGGSALLWASVLDQLGDGRVVAIDRDDRLHAAAARHKLWSRVDWIIGSTTDPEIVADVHLRCDGKRTMVILDSDHAADHVGAELDAYADLVSPGSYMIAQDGFVSDLDPEHGPGPREAVEKFLARDDRFAPDPVRERMLSTFNPGGFLRRVR